MYDHPVKAITITIPEELDAEATAEARRRGISKSELIRRGLRTVLPASNALEDPWRDFAGFATEGLDAPPGEVDRIVYDQ